MHIPSDVISFFGPNDTVILYNVFARTSLAVDAAGMTALMALQQGKNVASETRVWDIHWFSNEEGLLCDPTRIIRRRGDWPEPVTLDGEGFRRKVVDLSLLVDDEEEYRARFAPKTSLLDFKHFGNFHQQLGQFLMVEKRLNPVKWWYEQKFTDDLSGIRDNLYKSVQETYLKRYFAEKLGKGISIADVGCGVGYYSRMMAGSGAEVLALDPNGDYIELAAKDAPGNLRFRKADIGTPGGLDHVESESMDFAFMSDALLFYFVPERPDQHADISILMKDLRRILKPGGTFISMEPHASFFLMPWLGAEDRPFTLLTEYRHRNFSIVPSMSDMVKAILPYGFTVSFLDEIYSEANEAVDARACGFAGEFPVWQLLEFTKTP